MRRWMWITMVVGCAARTAPTPPVPEAPEHMPVADDGAEAADDDPHGAAEGVEDPELAALLREHWEATMERWPTWALRLGDDRFDDRLADPSPEARAAWLERRRGWRDRARALSERDDLSARDRTTARLLWLDLDTGLEVDEACRFHEWSLSPRGNALVSANWLADDVDLDTPEEGAALLSRLRQVPATIDADIASLRRGLADGRVGNAHSTRLVIDMVRAQVDGPVGESPLLLPATHEDLEGWPEADADAFRADLEAVVTEEIRPALRRYLALLEDELLPEGRAEADIGVSALGGGVACYEALVRSSTTLARTPEELHQTGLEELESIHAEFRELGARALETDDLEEIFARLRTDEALYFDSAEEVEESARAALARAREAIPAWFGRLPEAPCEVEPVPDYLAPYTTIAYYSRAAPDGSRPGIYYVNTLEPETRPRHEAEVLAFHESIPGHHLQIAIAQELDALPAFRRHLGMTAFVEGWALYTERLSDEMGLYSGDLDRLGMLSFDAWRASRLVVDTGIHAMGWSRERAEAFLLDNTPLAPNNVTNEVDRYINTPGQALAYKTGQLELRRLRAEAEDALGDDFDVADFHDVVLGGGAVSLPVLDATVQTWIDEETP